MLHTCQSAQPRTRKRSEAAFRVRSVVLIDTIRPVLGAINTQQLLRQGTNRTPHLRGDNLFPPTLLYSLVSTWLTDGWALE